MPTQPGGRAIVKLDFLPERKCPHCGSRHLRIKARPGYLRCGNCDGSFRWNEKLGRLVELTRRRKYKRAPQFGRPAAKRAVFVEAKRLRSQTPPVPWPKVARLLTPEAYREDPRRAAEAIRKGAGTV